MIKNMPLYNQYYYLISIEKVLESWTCKQCREKIILHEKFIQGCYLYNRRSPIILQLLQECISPAFLCSDCWEHARCEVLYFGEYKYIYQDRHSNQKNSFENV